MGASDMLALPRRRSIRLRGYNFAQAGGYFVTLCTEGMDNWFGEIVGSEMILNTFGAAVAEEWLRTPTMRPHVTLDQYIIMPNHLHGIILINDQDHRETPSPHAVRRGVSHTPVSVPVHDAASDSDDGERRGVLPTPARDASQLPLVDQAPTPLESGRRVPSNGQEQDGGRMQYAPTNAVGSADDGGQERTSGRMQYTPTQSLRSPSQTLGAIVRGFKAASASRLSAMCGRSRLRVWQRNYYEHVIRNEADLERIRAYIANNPARWAEDDNNPERER